MTINRTIFCLFLALTLSACGNAEKLPSNAVEHAVSGAYTASLSDDGTLGLVSSVSHGLALWDLNKNGLMYQWSHQQAEDNLVLSTDISFDKSVAVTADKENFALWDIVTGGNIGFWKIKDSAIRDIAVSDQGRYILYGKSNGVVVHIDMQTGRRIEFIGHQEKINAVDLSPNGYYALTGSNDYTAFLWDTRTAQVIHRFNHPSRVTQVQLDPKGRFAFTADSQQQARVWDLQSGEMISNLQFTSRQQIFSTARFNRAGTLLLTGSPTRKIALWDIKTGKELQTWYVTPRKESRPQSAVVYDVAFHPDDKTIVSESSSGLAETWQIEYK
ncbi:WD40 repeat domain-containing protein [Pseudoalteromonas tunicata]|jgi:WD40 repeat protein|uniref:Uncharacterized protein n=1 Tax=Pseudoalteromonas tunicata D2 TaxID=87626 RepID=A4CFS3_9GAMM|nr:hypothetical protein [Pseudoalteromonas tunicata]ATC92903.1 hypothetical protein PTUN_a0057 [Pseudoalteromonas tunicata]AXT32004.1 hypothetical protein D1819_15020 [Pseudoalteromonas tunicata]EAR26411.1 hypothetical protein PTD2_09652 [Pseudoalteromonas tunicata D2]